MIPFVYAAKLTWLFIIGEINKENAFLKTSFYNISTFY